MAVVDFPPVELADEHGLLAIGGDFDMESLILAYSEGIFPWPLSEDHPLAWFSPDPRGVIYTKDFHTPKSLKKFLNNCPYQIKYNTCFEEVIKRCETVYRKGQNSTWITPYLRNSYINLFNHGFAYSVEAFDSEELVGGVYGVCIGEIFSGESMFHLKDNASKVCLHHLCKQLHSKGIKMLDTQMVTPVVAMLGGVEIARNKFISNIKKLNLQKPRTHILES